jgi:hypothetical protein
MRTKVVQIIRATYPCAANTMDIILTVVGEIVILEVSQSATGIA